MEALRVPKAGQEPNGDGWATLIEESAQVRIKHRQVQDENQRLKRCLYALTMQVQEAQLTTSAKLQTYDVDSALAQVNTHAPEPGGATQTLLDLDDRSRIQADNKFGLFFDILEHTGPVYTTRFSPCGGYLASGSADCKICITEMGTLSSERVVHRLEAHPDPALYS